MQSLVGERVLMRVHVSESDRACGKPAFRAVVELLRDRGYSGATVLHAVMGFGLDRHLHDVQSEYIGYDMPLVVECIETEERITAILPELDRILQRGMVTLERANVILYRPADSGTSVSAPPGTMP